MSSRLYYHKKFSHQPAPLLADLLVNHCTPRILILWLIATSSCKWWRIQKLFLRLFQTRRGWIYLFTHGRSRSFTGMIALKNTKNYSRSRVTSWVLPDGLLQLASLTIRSISRIKAFLLMFRLRQYLSLVCLRRAIGDFWFTCSRSRSSSSHHEV